MSAARGPGRRIETAAGLNELTEPAGALEALGVWLRAQQTPISPFVVESREQPTLGIAAAGGRAAAAAPAQYALVIEAVREGYLLHYGEAAPARRP